MSEEKKFDCTGLIKLNYKCLKGYKNHPVDGSYRKKGEEVKIDMGFKFNHSDSDDQIITLINRSKLLSLRRYFYDKYINDKIKFNKVNKKL